MSAKSSDDNDDVALVKSKEYSDDSHGPSNSTNTTTRFSLTRSSAPRRGPQPGVLIEIPKTTVRQLPNQDISSERSLRLRNISKSPPRNPKSGAKVPDIIEVGDDSPKRFKLSHDAGSELLRPKTSRGRIEDDIFPKSSRTFSSNNVLSVENRETETVNKSEYFSAEESDDPILEVTGKGRGKAEEHTMSRTLYTSQLRSQPLPVHHTYTKGTGANVIASRGEDVNRYQSEDPYSDEDRERHRDLDRGRYPSIVESPPLSHNSPPSNLREQSNNKDILECWLEHLSIGKRTYRHSEYRLKVVVKNKLYSLYIQDLNDVLRGSTTSDRIYVVFQSYG
ncbi:hypothetical protein BC937DRAFT_95087 [Endogone sp. FLAS-F59071]|nr:hypothetical protein BC937DRAFT_95087 [Endogone sp. FLAS-F59071]|eukprot:RUS13588.1 hypothetical protein BC937DRAFT_95087 [Endogone sp. FLAS-F59071]